jgi:hypothetical protein
MGYRGYDTRAISQVMLHGGGFYMDENQRCVTALVEICKDFVNYLNTLKEKGILDEEEYEQYTKRKYQFIHKMEK